MKVGPALLICATNRAYHHLVVARSSSICPRARLYRRRGPSGNVSSSRIGLAAITGKNSSARWTKRTVVESGSMT